MPRKHQCKDCGKAIFRYDALRCRECYIKWLKGNLPKTAFKKGQNLAENHPNWKGGKWCWVRRYVINRDEGVCQICGLEEKDIMDVAHKKGHENKGKDRRYEKHNPDDLFTCCPNCHRRYDLGKLQ